MSPLPFICWVTVRVVFDVTPPLAFAVAHMGYPLLFLGSCPTRIFRLTTREGGSFFSTSRPEYKIAIVAIKSSLGMSTAGAHGM